MKSLVTYRAASAEGRGKALSSQLGMTMIEIMVVLAIMGGLMIVLLGSSLLKSNSARLREASVEVLVTLRAAYNMATMTGQHHRVVFDLEKQAYHIEVCSGRQTMKKGDEEEVVDMKALEKLKEKLEKPASNDINSEILQAASPEKAAEAAAALEGLRVGSSRCQPAVNTISGQPSKSGNKHRLDTERGMSIEKIHVQHLNDAVDDAVVSINFFPVGSAEKAVVELANKDNDSFSILVFGMTSRVEFRNGSIDVDEHMLRDGAGDDVEERK